MRISDWSSDVCSSDLRAPHRAHWQSKDYNALHGGLRRWFEPVSDAVANSPAWSRPLLGLSTQVSRLHDARPWDVEAPHLRSDPSDGIGRPTREAPHPAGCSFLASILVPPSRLRDLAPA